MSQHVLFDLHWAFCSNGFEYIPFKSHCIPNLQIHLTHTANDDARMDLSVNVVDWKIWGKIFLLFKQLNLSSAASNMPSLLQKMCLTEGVPRSSWNNSLFLHVSTIFPVVFKMPKSVLKSVTALPGSTWPGFWKKFCLFINQFTQLWYTLGSTVAFVKKYFSFFRPCNITTKTLQAIWKGNNRVIRSKSLV